MSDEKILSVTRDAKNSRTIVARQPRKDTHETAYYYDNGTAERYIRINPLLNSREDVLLIEKRYFNKKENSDE